jgi:hypothetical protein
VDTDKLDEIESAIRELEPGRYHIDQIEAKPLPCGHTSRQWGVASKKVHGSLAIEPEPSEA